MPETKGDKSIWTVLDDWHQSSPIEIRSGAIIPFRDSFLIEAQTGSGRRRFCPAHEIQGDAQSDRTADIPILVRMFCELQHVLELHWESSPLVINTSQTTNEPSPRIQSNGAEEIVPTADEIIAKLYDESTDHSELRRAILAAESIPFNDAEKLKLCKGLEHFIRKYRDKDNLQDLVAVGAAIRKLVTNISIDDISSLGWVLEAGHRASIPLEIELEVGKMLVWKLKSNPFRDYNRFSELSERLLELCRAYLNDRLLPREKFAATALNASLALALMGCYVDEVLEMLNQVHLPWFKQLMSRRAQRIITEMRHRFEPDAIGTIISNLRGIAELTV